MIAESILWLFIVIPLVGFIISIVLPPKKENLISVSTYLVVGVHMIIVQLYIIFWMIQGSPFVNHKDMVLFSSGNYTFFIDFCFDKITATYLCVGSILTFLVTIYSRYYLHREQGYKRFFNTILFFYLGYNITILSGNMETLFIGWEVLGISSFLLIAFYRDRYLPVKNAVKVFSIYRIGDIGILLAMWLSHHLWSENITFLKLNNFELVHHQLETHSLVGIAISLLIVLTAAAKSAQLPFSSWLPRAMEGPTPSSAIFYGSLSVHLGVFLLMRTYPFWEHQLSVRILIVMLGLATSIITTGIARVQSSVKSQIAYASISQIGVIFIEIALGFETLALVHFAGNAFLRTYQLLVSPSVVTYLIREQFYNFTPREETFEESLPAKLKNTFYILSLKEWNLDQLLYQYLWYPFKLAGRKVEFMTMQVLLMTIIPFYIAGSLYLIFSETIPQSVQQVAPVLFALIGLLLVIKAFVERRNVFLGWTAIVMNHFWIALAISFNEAFNIQQTIYYLGGIVGFGLLGLICLNYIQKEERQLDLTRFYGYSGKHPVLAFIFLMACLGVAGFPISPSFIGEDLIFTHIHENQPILAFFVALSLIIDGLALIRLYARIFLGPDRQEFSRSS